MSNTPEQQLNEAYDHGFVLDEFFDVMNDVIFEWRELRARESEGVVVEILINQPHDSIYWSPNGFPVVNDRQIESGTYRLTRVPDDTA